MDAIRTKRGFLPEHDPLVCFPVDSALAVLDRIGRELPELLEDPAFRSRARELDIPHWPEASISAEQLPALRLYYVRLGFLASGYINQVGQPAATVLPRNIAVPLAQACKLLKRPPILSYDGYALYNWRRLDPSGPIALGNIDTFQNFVRLYDEHWFILVHVEIESIAADIFAAIDEMTPALVSGHSDAVNRGLVRIGDAVRRQVAVLRRIPERMDPRLYYKTFRPYIRFFENVVYEGVDQAPVDHRGETGAQSSIMPALIAFLKIPHRPSPLVDHLTDMRRYMPAEHRALLDEIARLPPVRPLAQKDVFNEVLEAIAEFRETHYGWAEQYINSRVADPRGTGGTPYMEWLRQLIGETRDWRL